MENEMKTWKRAVGLMILFALGLTAFGLMVYVAGLVPTLLIIGTSVLFVALIFLGIYLAFGP